MVDPVFLTKVKQILEGHLDFIRQVYFVPTDSNNAMGWSILPNIFQPVVGFIG